jgi:hypothetical protein
MRIDAGRLVIETDTDGRVVGVAPRSRPERGFLVAVDLGACRVAGADAVWSGRDVAVDSDEIGVRAVAGGLEVSLRHSFATGWTTRLLVVNPGTAPAVLERLQLIVRPAPGQRLSALAAGSRLCWAVQPADGEGPLLAARLATGAVAQVSEDGLELGALRLAPGQRYVTQLRWELFATARSVVAGPGRDVLIVRTAYEIGEPVLLPADPDAALVTPTGVAVDAVEDAELSGREVVALDPGRHRIELHSAEGDVRWDLSWVRPLGAQLELWAASVLDRPRTGAGVVAVDDLPGAVVLQAALGAGGLAEADQAADALDRLTARLVEDPAGNPEPLAVLFLLGEHGRTGDPDPFSAALERESALLAADGPPIPGLGLAVLRTVLAGAGSDPPERVAPLVARAVQRAEASPGGFAVGLQAAELELLLAVRPLLPDDHPTQQRLLSLVRGLGAALGSGLPGRLLSPLAARSW